MVGKIRYSPFGEIIEQTGVVSPRGYTGEFQNPANNLTYLQARYYDPKLGRFLTQDSIIPDMLNGQAWNAYAYVYNDTLNLVDPNAIRKLERKKDRSTLDAYCGNRGNNYCKNNI